MNQEKICTACGTQFPAGSYAPEICPICTDDRQYIPQRGQTWTNHDELTNNYSVITKKLHDNLYELRIAPGFGIEQRALLVLSPGGNILWDCIALLNEATIDFIKAKGGLKAIAFSHPHYYSNMHKWADVFDCPIYIHQTDEQWMFGKGDKVSLWNGTEKELWDGIKLINIGGHFPGSSVLHIPSFSPEGAILCGDTFAVSLNKKHISVMYSYPNRVPLPLHEMHRIKKQILAVPFDTIHGYATAQDIYGTAKELMEISMDRYV